VLELAAAVAAATRSRWSRRAEWQKLKAELVEASPELLEKPAAREARPPKAAKARSELPFRVLAAVGLVLLVLLSWAEAPRSWVARIDRA
jgi:hypothetical protein